jgi:hypothetical protein
MASYKKTRCVEFITDCPFFEDGLPNRAKIKELYGGKQKKMIIS